MLGPRFGSSRPSGFVGSGGRRGGGIQPHSWARHHGSASGALDMGEDYENENDVTLVYLG